MVFVLKKTRLLMSWQPYSVNNTSRKTLNKCQSVIDFLPQFADFTLFCLFICVEIMVSLVQMRFSVNLCNFAGKYDLSAFRKINLNKQIVAYHSVSDFSIGDLWKSYIKKEIQWSVPATILRIEKSWYFNAWEIKHAFRRLYVIYLF